MAKKLKEVPSAEVHWQIGTWNVRDAANSRIKTFMGPDAQYFAPVYVTPGSYYWSEPDPEGWVKLTVATPEDQAEARRKIAEIKARALHKLPGKSAILDQVFSFPNDDFIFVRRRAGDHLELRLTGWGFANYKRGTAGTIIDTTVARTINRISVSFSVDGQKVAHRPFRRLQGTAWVDETTGDDGDYDFGPVPPGNTLTVRDGITAIERIIEIDENTTHTDIDVTEMVNFRVAARMDGEPISGESATMVYGRRKSVLPLQFGVASGLVPLFEGEECAVTFRGETQRHELYRDNANEFVFDLFTPHIPHTAVDVRVTGDGAPKAGEKVKILIPGGERQVVTDANGMAHLEFDLPSEGFNIETAVRDQNQTKAAVDGNVLFEYVFDTPPAVLFDATIRVVNLEGKPLPSYPVTLDLGDGAGTGSFLTDSEGRIGPFHVVGGNILTAWDGNKPANTAHFTLTPEIVEYEFKLPYTPTAGTEMSLRVITLGNKPAAGVTCIVSNPAVRVTATLNPAGQMLFGEKDFPVPSEVGVDLYTPSRQFPHIPLGLEKDEHNYELVEVTGPQPWWKTAAEIALVAATPLVLTGAYFALKAILWNIPHIF